MGRKMEIMDITRILVRLILGMMMSNGDIIETCDSRGYKVYQLQERGYINMWLILS